MNTGIKSMTGFGRGEYSDADIRICVEMKAVNHRYLDLGIKMPRRLNMLEGAVRNAIREHAQRGKIDVYITYENLSGNDTQLTYNKTLAQEYVKYIDDMAVDFSLENDLRSSVRLASFPGVFNLAEVAEDDDVMNEHLLAALKAACVSFDRSRLEEGARLKTDLLAKLSDLRGYVAEIEERVPDIITEYKQNLTDKVKELLGDVQIDEARLVTEVTIFADKVAVDEEIVRLKAHIEAMENELGLSQSVGRKLDFIAQEMNREANTTLSKSSDLKLSNTAIEVKTLIEKIREQVQNIE